MRVVDVESGQHGGGDLPEATQRQLDVIALAACGHMNAIAHAEWADGSASQRGEVTAHAEPGAKVARKSTDVGTGRAVDLYIEIDPAVDIASSHDVEATDTDRSRGQLHVFTGTGAGVGALSVDFDGAHGGGHLLDVAAQRINASLDLCGCQGARIAPLPHRLAFTVIGRCALPQADRGRIGLIQSHQVCEQPGSLPDTEHEQAGGHRVERACVTDLLRPEQPAHTGDHVMAGAIGRLVHQHNAVHVGAGSACTHARRSSLSVSSSASAAPCVDCPLRAARSAELRLSSRSSLLSSSSRGTR